jgi:hypothetical protein
MDEVQNGKHSIRDQVREVEKSKNMAKREAKCNVQNIDTEQLCKGMCHKDA